MKEAAFMNMFVWAGLATMVTVGANAQTPAAVPTKVGVIQIQAALGATKEGQKAAADLEVKFGPRKKELDVKQSEIKDMQDKLAKGANTLSDANKEELTRGIDAKTKSYNRDIEDAQAELEGEQQKILSGLGQKMMQVIDKYAQANGYSVVLDVSNQNTPVLYASNTIDITKDIIELYDKTTFNTSTNVAPAGSRPAGAAANIAPAPKPAVAAPKPAAPAVAPAKK